MQKGKKGVRSKTLRREERENTIFTDGGGGERLDRYIHRPLLLLSVISGDERENCAEDLVTPEADGTASLTLV